MKSSVEVLDWGPRFTTKGEPVNLQPDGSSAMWIRIASAPGSRISRVDFGSGRMRQAHSGGEDVITCEIPDDVLHDPGSHLVCLLDSKGHRTPFGHFEVKEGARSHATTSVRTALLESVKRIAVFPGFGFVGKLLPQTNTSRERPTLKKILVADYRIPRGDVSAGEKATIGLLRDLTEIGYDVVFLAADMEDNAQYRSQLTQLGVKVVTRSSQYRRPSDYIRAQGHRFGTFYLIRIDVAEKLISTIRRASPNSKIIFHAPDLYYLRESRAAQLSGNPDELDKALATREQENLIMTSADHVVIVSPAELSYVEDVAGKDRISVFPALYSEVHYNEPRYDQRQNIFFLGGFKHLPNISAVQWFVEAIWPTVHAEIPEAEFHIIGAEAPDDIVSLSSVPGVRFRGFVSKLEGVLGSYRVSVAPLLFGAGIKGKLGAAMGAATPVVSTSIGAEGMHIVDGVQALVRDDPEGFARAVINLYRDQELWTRLSESGLSLIEQRFSGIANRSALLRTLEAADALDIDAYVRFCQSRAPFSLPSPDGSLPIDVSIIIPVHNNWHLTRACLNSVCIATTSTGLNCEVIIADDASTDETTAVRSHFQNLRVVRQEQNWGFLLNCKAAAAIAGGRMLLFLNNDTVVLPNWLTALFRTMNENSEAAIVGSQLLYPDGYVQEAGCVLFSDGTAYTVGRGEQRSSALFRIDRETDYISGASIMVRHSFWKAVGGFDERYVPAYCEDSDLAMAARSRGHNVVYSGKSVVIHFEHGTYGEHLSTPTTLMTSNNKKLVTKWRNELTTKQLRPGVPPLLAAAYAERTPSDAALQRRKKEQFNILYFSPFPTHPGNHGNQATIRAFANLFQKMGHKVHFALLESNMYSNQDVIDMQTEWDSLDILKFNNPMSTDGNDVPFDGWYEPGLGDRIYSLCKTYDIDVVMCSYVFQSKILDYVPSHALKLIDTHDKMGDRYRMLKENGQRAEFFSCTPEDEGAYLRRADVVVARRYEEAQYFNEVSGQESSVVVPHVEPIQFLSRNYDSLSKVGVVASANRINLAIIHQFLKAMGERFGDSCPFQVEIAGQVSEMIGELDQVDQDAFRRPWLQLLGFVPDISSFYGAVDLIVSPVTMGTGINVKTVQAMAYGMPLVTTKEGIKGIETDEPLHAHRSINELVESLARVHREPSELNRLAMVSRRKYEQFSKEAEAALRSLLKHPKLCFQTMSDVGLKQVS